MLTGQRAFAGEDVSDTLANVLKMEPDWVRLPAEVPARIRQVLRVCLQKDPRQRAQAIGERLALEGAFETTVPGAAALAPAARRRPLWTRAVPMVAAAVVAGAMVGASAWMLRPPAPPLPVTRFPLALSEGQQFSTLVGQSLAVSPDGAKLVYVANNRLYLRSMSDLEARPIPGTQQTPTPNTPVFSPDGESIAFVSAVDRAVKKIAVIGGAAVTLCPVDEVNRVLGMTWDAGGIVFGQTNVRPIQKSWGRARGSSGPCDRRGASLAAVKCPDVILQSPTCPVAAVYFIFRG
jgi:eukaryotic-like serine/threonine-protein kinase